MRLLPLLTLIACAAEPSTWSTWAADGAWRVEGHSEPSPPAAGVVHLQLALFDPADEPLDVPEIAVNAWMDAHDHATVHAFAEPVSTGAFDAQLNLPMPGRWVIGLEVDAPDRRDEAELTLDVR